MRQQAAIGFILLFALLWVWPNAVHEPLHMVALMAQDVDSTIQYDWSWPAQPRITANGSVSSVSGGLFFLLLPSLFSLFLLGVLWLTRTRAAFLTHIVVPTYLVFDLVTNMLGYKSTTNDFHFFTVYPLALYLVVLLISGVGCVLMWNFMRNIHARGKHQEWYS